MMLQDRGTLLKEEGDVAREYKAMHEEHFPSCWLREDVEGLEERRKATEEKAREERTLIKKRSVNLISSDVFEEFSPVGDSGSIGDSWGDFYDDSCGFSVRVLVVSLGVLVVTDVSRSPSSIGVLGEASPSDSECGEFGRRRAAFVKKKLKQWTEVCKSWAAVCQSTARRMLSRLDNCEALKVGAKECLHQMNQVSTLNTLRVRREVRIAKMFQIFSRQGAKEIMVSSVARWEEHLRMLTVLKRQSLDLSDVIANLSSRCKEDVSGHRSRKTEVSTRYGNMKKLGTWESFKEDCRKERKLCEWTFERLQEACDKVAMGDIGRLSITREFSLRTSTDFWRRIIAPMSTVWET